MGGISDNRDSERKPQESKREIDMNDLFPPREEVRLKDVRKNSFFYSLALKVLLFFFGAISLSVGVTMLLYDVYSNGMVFAGSILLILGLGAFCWSCVITGKTSPASEVQSHTLDMLPIEIQLLMTAALGGLWTLFLYDTVFYSTPGYAATILILYFFVGMLFVSGMQIFILSTVRQLKSHRWNFLVYRFWHQLAQQFKRIGRAIVNFFKSFLDGRRFKKYSFQKQVFMRQRIYVVALAAAALMSCFTSLASFFTCVIGILLTFWFVRENNKTNEDIGKLADQIEAVYRGDLNYQTTLDPLSPLYDVSQKLSGVSHGFQKSVEEQVKSERMKIDLVTNVSHDLKTPLTSIISYIDLLSKEEGLSPEAEDYVRILAQKSDRLKNIVADLFDLAKITSGNAEIVREELDMARLVVQTLGDMEDKIESSGHILKTSLIEPPVPILGDGKKLYRVMQNIFDNALKYAMKGTRIYIDLSKNKERVLLTVKNTSAYEMTFTEEEILERFTRGDKARSTEGSGLGLSIAKSFTEACGGEFGVSIDGDQFKVMVAFPLNTLHEDAVQIEEKERRKRSEIDMDVWKNLMKE